MYTPLHPQGSLPLPPLDTLPTMYDLPSEDPEEPGLPDEFHHLQPQLLTTTLRLNPPYVPDNYFSGSDLNLYYDPYHTLWHKRPDWFLVLGVPRLYGGADLRLSYVVWQEGVSPLVVVELLSPSTEDEDLGRNQRTKEPPCKWEVYERWLQVPYYVLYDRYTDQMRAFRLRSDGYEEVVLAEPRLWIEELDLGMGLWFGSYQGIERRWLRWYDEDGQWIATETERAQRQAEMERQRAEMERRQAEMERQRAEMERRQAEIERQRAEMERQRADRLAELLRQQGIDPDNLL